MMIRFACGTCNERLAVPPRYAGRRGRCPACGATNRVPPTSTLPEPMPLPTAPVASIVSVAPEGAAARLPPRSTPASPKAEPFPDVVPIGDDEPAQMLLFSPTDDAAGVSTRAKVLFVMFVLLGLFALIWGASLLFFWLKLRAAHRG